MQNNEKQPKEILQKCKIESFPAYFALYRE